MTPYAQDSTHIARSALLWVLWHHQGANSNVGQPIRFALGIDRFDRMSEADIQRAKMWGTLMPQIVGSDPQSAHDLAHELWAIAQGKPIEEAVNAIAERIATFSIVGLGKVDVLPVSGDVDQGIALPAAVAQKVEASLVHIGGDEAEQHLQTAGSALPHGADGTPASKEQVKLAAECEARGKLINIALGLMDTPPGASLVVEVAKLVNRIAASPVPMASSAGEPEEIDYDLVDTIIRDVCELDGGARNAAIQELSLSVDELRVILERNLADAPPAASLREQELEAEVARLNAIINSPQSDDFIRAVSTEAEHQRQRWGADGDAGKTPADWFWLVGYLAGKALHSHAAGNEEKAEHHVITTAAACANWHRAIFGNSDMRPGIDAQRLGREKGKAS